MRAFRRLVTSFHAPIISKAWGLVNKKIDFFDRFNRISSTFLLPSLGLIIKDPGIGSERVPLRAVSRRRASRSAGLKFDGAGRSFSVVGVDEPEDDPGQFAACEVGELTDQAAISEQPLNPSMFDRQFADNYLMQGRNHAQL
ncbi:MAG: hypothetical protein JO329_25115, partial [Planctomycetaceae bacterium]|nr:hypothetical protein [Planctomycetaceae bacterium]